MYYIIYILYYIYNTYTVKIKKWLINIPQDHKKRKGEVAVDTKLVYTAQSRAGPATTWEIHKTTKFSFEQA